MNMRLLLVSFVCLVLIMLLENLAIRAVNEMNKVMGGWHMKLKENTK